MLVQRPVLHPAVTAAIKTLASKGLYPAPDHVVWLQDAALNIKRTTRTSLAQMIDSPIECGGVDFYPLTLLAIDWLINLPQELQSDVLVQAYASAHGRTMEPLRSLRVPWRVRLAVWGWARGITASRIAVVETLAAVSDDDEMVDVAEKAERINKKPTRSRSADFGAVAFQLSKKYTGTTSEYWLCECSSSYALQKLESSDSAAVEGSDITALVAFRSIVSAIEEELKAEVDNG